MQIPLKTFEPNLLGRDFVIGDLHGAYELFAQLLRSISFDPTKDRMFSVGDLVDRGDDSLTCLALLKEPWFHSVLANHEQMMIEAFDGGYLGQFWINNGGFWGMAALSDYHRFGRGTSGGPHALWELLDDVRDLPWLITVKMKDGKRFHVLHAELPPGRLITDELLEDPVEVAKLAEIETKDGSFLCWGRHIFGRLYDIDLSNKLGKIKRIIANISGLTTKKDGTPGLFSDKLSHVISGHTIMHHPTTVLGQTNIDTCAYEALFPDRAGWEALTCVELGSWSFYQQRKDDFRTVSPVEVNMADIMRIRNEEANTGGIA